MSNQSEIVILNVDHNPINRQCTSQILHQAGFVVLEANTGAQALSLARTKHPDIILLEIDLPDISGFSVGQQLKADRGTAAIPIAHIANSYLSNPELLNSEAEAYLTRPVESPVLLATLKSLGRSLSQKNESNRCNQELELLNRVMAASASAMEVERILDSVCRELALALDVPLAAASLLNDSKSEAIIVAEYRTEAYPSALNDTIPVTDNPFFQYLLSHKVPLVVTNTHTNQQVVPMHRLTCRQESVSLLALPVIIKGEVVGCLGLESAQERQFLAEEINLAWRVIEQVGGALARARLTHTQQRLIAAIEQAGEIIVITDIGGSIVYVNPAFERITGYSKIEALGQRPSLVKSGRQDRSVYEQLWHTIMAGEVWRGRFINRKKDGSLYTVNATIAPVRNEADTIIGYVGVERDVTHELSLEEQLRQSQKMEAVGRLAGGVAHDFNNLLTVINGYSNLLLDHHPDPNDLMRKDIEQIKRAGERASNLTRQLLAFSRKQILKPTILDLNMVVADMETLLRRLLGEDISIYTRLEPMLGRIKADRGQLEQVIMNLAINARDAMQGGGQLTLETANVTLDELYTSQKVEVEPGNYVLLAISDTGIGITQETQAHIFEPFFTTKEEGKGTGLGLATVHGIIKQSGGHINVYSEAGQGTTFKIYLPPFQDAAPNNKVTSPATLPRGVETILVVEDEARVRELVSRVLRSSGYTVLEANSGREALQLYGHQNGPIQLLLTDVVMPGMNGRMLADRLKVVQPGLKVIYMSGYTDDAIIQHGVLDAGAIFIQKPFTTDALIRRVRETLDKPVKS